jgi:hypothetical protein
MGPRGRKGDGYRHVKHSGARAERSCAALSGLPLGSLAASGPPARGSLADTIGLLCRLRSGCDLLPIPLFDRTLQRGPWHGTADEIALGAIAPDTIQEIEYFLRFDAFGASG